jgi:hypothetical protein
MLDTISRNNALIRNCEQGRTALARWANVRAPAKQHVTFFVASELCIRNIAHYRISWQASHHV